MMIWASMFLAFAAFTAIAASMDRHGDQFHTDALSHRQLRLWRAGGYTLLGVSLLPCLMHWSTSVALATWTGLLAFSAAALGLMLTYCEQHIPRTAPMAGLLGLMLWLLFH